MKISLLGGGIGGSVIGMFPPNYYITLEKDNVPILFDTLNGFYFWRKRLNKYYLGDLRG